MSRFVSLNTATGSSLSLKGIVWFKYSDLRLTDHVPLFTAHQQNAEVAHIFCIDERWVQTRTRFGMRKTGNHRMKFLLESLTDLRRNLQTYGSDLIVKVGKPEECIPKLAKELQAHTVYSHSEICSEEVEVDTLTKDNCGSQTAFWQCWGNTLFNIEDLPFTIERMPTTYTQFRVAVEKTMPMKRPSPSPVQWRPFPEAARAEAEASTIPSLEELGYDPVEADPRAVLNFEGGETAGMERLQAYFFDRDCLRRYKETRNGLLGADFSSKFSPWLAHGCLSPRTIYQQIKLYEQQRVANDSTYWMFFELLWRDFFHFLAVRYGNDIFKLGGPQKNPRKQQWAVNEAHFEAWCNGQTGYPFIDANMRELKATGFMSNRGRQVVASFLVKDMNIDWRAGAEFFEEWLLDYDPCSNWGNWNYVAGVGSDPREDRYFNVVKQATVYDGQGEYMKHWCPELSSIPSRVLMQPQTLLTQQVRLQFCLDDAEYPPVIIQLKHGSFDNRPKGSSQKSQPGIKSHFRATDDRKANSRSENKQPQQSYQSDKTKKWKRRVQTDYFS